MPTDVTATLLVMKYMTCRYTDDSNHSTSNERLETAQVTNTCASQPGREEL